MLLHAYGACLKFEQRHTLIVVASDDSTSWPRWALDTSDIPEPTATAHAYFVVNGDSGEDSRLIDDRRCMDRVLFVIVLEQR